MGLTAPYSEPSTGFKRGESQGLNSEFRGALRSNKVAPRNVGAGERQRFFPEGFSGRADRDGALMGGSKGRASKLIFFLTIDNSPALNDPVATQVKTGESMHRSASGSRRPLPSWRLVSVRGSGAAQCRFSGCTNPQEGHCGRNESRPEKLKRVQDAHQPASFLPDGEATLARNNHSNNFEKEGHMRQARYRFFLLPVLLVLACVGAFAQANSELTGIITDQSGAVVAGATVTLTDPATGCYQNHRKRRNRSIRH